MRKLLLFFVALLATTILWARPFQVGDLYYKVPGDNGIESLPFVPNPGAGRTTVVLYCVPENTPAGCYAVGTVNSWDSNNTDFMFTPIEGAGTGWVACTFDYEPNMQIKVLAIPSDPDFLGWSYQWGKNIDWENDLEEDNVVILEGSGYLELEYQGEPKLVELADGGVIYIEVKDWANNPYVEPVPCESAAFGHSWGGGDWTYREATKTAQATFEINAIYGGSGLNVATDVYATHERWYYDQIEFVGDVAQGDSVNFKFISEKQTIGRMIVTLIEKGTGVDNPWYTPTKKSPTVSQKHASTNSPLQVVVTRQPESSDNYAYLSTAYIPETVVYNGRTYEVVGIDEYAFANSPISSITIPNSVTSIGNGAFNGCKSLTSITIPNSVTSIGWDAFSFCSSLTSITIPNSVTSIGDWAFGGCSSLTSVTIPSSVTSIGRGAFAGCKRLTSITIPSCVISIGEEVFSYCYSLTSVVVESDNAIYDSRENCNAIIETVTNKVIAGCKKSIIPNSITSIGDWAFYGSSIASISIPNSVTSIGDLAFLECESLLSISIPNSVTSIGESAFADCLSLVSVNMGNNITSIEDGTFEGCTSLATISLSNSIENIGEEAFASCTSLKSFTVPNSVKSIGEEAFAGCETLGTIVLGDKVKEIGNYAFNGCDKLYHIYCYAPEPPIADEDVFTNYNVNLYVPCNYLDNYKYDRVFGSFRYIQCMGADSENVPTDDVVVTPGTNDVTITWPTEGNADTYTIVIKKGNEVFCTLTFNADGQLLNIAFAPGRDGNHPVQYAEQAGNGYRFTVTGLEEGTHYAYNIDVKDAADKTIKSHTGEFTTESMTAVEDVEFSENANAQKIFRDQQILILRDGVEYTIMGQEL